MSDFYNKYPYTDFHELNLDWIIERVKQLTEDWLETKQAWENTEADWQELYDYVHDYFNNLDVQEEINNKINAMIADGTFVTITTPVIEAKVASMMPGTVASQIGDTVASQIGNTVASQIDAVVASQIDTPVATYAAAWLNDHITQPTTPAIDNSLTVAGAAADAKVTGYNIFGYNYLKKRHYPAAATVTNGYYDASSTFNVNQSWTLLTFTVSLYDHFAYKLNSAYTAIPKIIELDSSDQVIRIITTSSAITESDYTVFDATVAKVCFQYSNNYAAMAELNDNYVELLSVEEKGIVTKDDDVTATLTQDSWYYTYHNSYVSAAGKGYYKVSCLPGETYKAINVIMDTPQVVDGIVVFFNGIIPISRIKGTLYGYHDYEFTVPSGADNFIVQTLYQYSGFDIVKKVKNFDGTAAVSAQASDIIERNNQLQKKFRFYYDSAVLGYVCRYKYTDSLDCAYRFKYKGTNQNFGLTSIHHITNTGDYPKETFNDFSNANQYYGLSSEWLSPYGTMKAVNNPDGDFTSGFTGGNHTLGSDVATMEPISLKIFLDGIETTIMEHQVYYCDKVDFEIVNAIQACNTCKNDGTGRAVVHETQLIEVTPDNVKCNVKINFLEDVTIDSYYGMQQEVYAWNGEMNFVGDPAHLETYSGSLSSIQGSVKAVAKPSGWYLVNSDGDELSYAVLDCAYGMGQRDLLDPATPTIISRDYGKFYTWLISNASFNGDDSVFYRCHYVFKHI